MSEIAVHRDDLGSKIGMWLFIFTEILLFGGLFIVYSVYRFKNPVAFHLGAEELSVKIGVINTVILLISSMTVAMSITAVQTGKRLLATIFLAVTILMALAFLVNKYFEWTGKFAHGIYPGSEILAQMGTGETLFFGLYFAMTGLHAIHIIVGLILLTVMMFKVLNQSVNSDYYVQLENSGLYWHLVDLIWIFLFPLFYLIS
jgi:cytochrome c oxidase subunit III